jgi:hypothetical protein
VCGDWEREEEEEEEYLSKAFLTCDALVQSPSLERVCLRAKKRAKKRHECVENDKKKIM